MLFFENIRLALNSIKSNKLRSFLTMLGIIIGISSVIAITSIGASARGAVSDEVHAYGGGYISLHMNWESMGDDFNPNHTLKMEDLNAVKNRFPDKVKYIAPTSVTSGRVKLSNSKNLDLEIKGMSGNYFDHMTKMKILNGRMLTDEDVRARKKVVVIDEMAKDKVFQGKNPVGQSMIIENNGLQEYIVIGVYVKEPSLFDKLMKTKTSTVFVPYTAMQNEVEWYSAEIFIPASDNVEEIKSVGAEIANHINNLKKAEGLYVAESAEEQLSIVNRVLGIISLAIGAIAAISLLVGGIGIMNIMLVSVTERTREIGIRKSLGARTADILMQFLIEAVFLSLLGGVIGVALGLGTAAIGMLVLKVRLVVQGGAVIIAVIFAGAVGLFFGLFPAKKAAKMDPIEALRYE